MTRVCSKCKKENNNPKKSWCYACCKIYLKAYRVKNKDHIKNLNKKWREKNKKYYKISKFKYFSTLKGRMVELSKSAKKRSLKRNLKFDLNSIFLENLWNKQKGVCAITGLPLKIPKSRNHGKARPFSPSIDRIDPKLGYIKENIRLVCYVVNCAIHDFGMDVFDSVANAYVNGFFVNPKIINDYEESEEFDRLTSKQKDDRKYRQSQKGVISKIFSECKNKKNNNLDFNLDKAFLVDLFRKQKCCSITKIPFDYKYYRKNKSNPFRPSLDRIDSKKGYTKDNVRLVCIFVNFALNEFGDKIFDKVCKQYIVNKSFN